MSLFEVLISMLLMSLVALANLQQQLAYQKLLQKNSLEQQAQKLLNNSYELLLAKQQFMQQDPFFKLQTVPNCLKIEWTLRGIEYQKYIPL